MSDNFEKYKGNINAIYKEVKVDLWTNGLATLVLFLFAALLATIIVNIVFISFGSWFVSFIVYFVEISVPVVVLYLHQQKVYEAVRERVLEIDAANPGIYEAYEEWRSKIDSPST